MHSVTQVWPALQQCFWGLMCFEGHHSLYGEFVHSPEYFHPAPCHRADRGLPPGPLGSVASPSPGVKTVSQAQDIPCCQSLA